MNEADTSSEDWALRYARQITLDGWGESAQRKLSERRVMIVGLGGLGSPVAMNLAAAGVGHLDLNDFDRVDLSNLPRQHLHSDKDIGELKTDSAKAMLERLNPSVVVTCHTQRFSETELTKALHDVDCVIDCSDNFGTRFGLNRAALKSDTPLISAAAIRGEGQLAVFRHDLAHSPCYRCLYNEEDETAQTAAQDCQGQGVLTPVVGIIGSLAATAVLNLLIFDRDNSGVLTCFDAQDLRFRHIRFNRNPDCPDCAAP